MYIFINRRPLLGARAPPWSCGLFQAAQNVRLPLNIPLLRLQSSEGKFTMSREIEPVRRSFRRHGSCTFTEVAHLVPSGNFPRVVTFPVELSSGIVQWIFSGTFQWNFIVVISGVSSFAPTLVSELIPANAEHGAYFIRWSNNHFNNLHFIISLETNDIITRAAE